MLLSSPNPKSSNTNHLLKKLIKCLTNQVKLFRRLSPRPLNNLYFKYNPNPYSISHHHCNNQLQLPSSISTQTSVLSKASHSYHSHQPQYCSNLQSNNNNL